MNYIMTLSLKTKRKARENKSGKGIFHTFNIGFASVSSTKFVFIKACFQRTILCTREDRCAWYGQPVYIHPRSNKVQFVLFCWKFPFRFFFSFLSLYPVIVFCQHVLLLSFFGEKVFSFKLFSFSIREIFWRKRVRVFVWNACCNFFLRMSQVNSVYVFIVSITLSFIHFHFVYLAVSFKWTQITNFY